MPRCAITRGALAALIFVLPSLAGAQAGDAIELGLRPLATAGAVVEPIGLTASGRRIRALEPTIPPVANQRRLVLVGGLDGTAESAGAVLDALTAMTGAATRSSNRRRWQVAAVPCVLLDRCDAAGGAAAATASTARFPPEKESFDAPEHREARFLWRWVSMLGPDLVIDVRRGDALEWRANGLAAALVPGAAAAAPDTLAGALGTGAPSGLAPVAALQVSGPPALVAAAVRTLIEGMRLNGPSPMRRALTERQARAPLDLARTLAGKYPAAPIMSYIPALSWSAALRVSELTGDPRFRDRAVAQIQPFLAGEKSAIAEPSRLTSLAGHQALFDLAAAEGDARAAAAARKAADFILATTADDIVRFATSWTDDMFMATSILARAAAQTGEARYADAVARLLTTYAQRLQREDRLFIHAVSGPHAWGRGNGFAAFGLMEALTHLPESWAARSEVLDIFRRQMSGLRRHQAPDGAWHQVVDEPGTYREFTVTAMTVAAMARGVRLGWLDRSYRSYRDVIDRGWRAVQARVSETGELLDVCTGTGAGENATRDYYLNRPAISGADDRGGAMALTAALEVHGLVTAQ